MRLADLTQAVRGNQFGDRVMNLILLIGITIVVHAYYVVSVRPGAEHWLAEQKALMAQNPGYKPGRSLDVIIMEKEPEASIIMAIWSVVLAVQQGLTVRRLRRLLDADLLQLAPGTCILPDDVRDHLRRLEQLPANERDTIVPRVLRHALKRFGATQNVQDASATVHQVCDSEAMRLDSELAMVRFGVWSIPAIGFVGTVRGLGEALQSAQFALSGNDPAAMTTGLGVSFNSTFVALTLSIFIMYIIYELQLAQERLALDTENYADEHLINNLKVS